MKYTIALFGEAQKGSFHTGYYCETLADLSEHLGEPPSKDSKGLYLAIQALLFKRDIIFFRVHEEGFSIPDYMKGLDLLENRETIPELSALCMPGMGNNKVIEAGTHICMAYQSFLILTESDLYDFLTHRD